MSMVLSKENLFKESTCVQTLSSPTNIIYRQLIIMGLNLHKIKYVQFEHIDQVWYLSRQIFK